MIDLLRRAWDSLDSFKQTYPENWHEDDEQVMVDLMRADMKLSGVQRTWVGLTDEEFEKMLDDAKFTRSDLLMIGACVDKIVDLVEAKLKEKNCG